MKRDLNTCGAFMGATSKPPPLDTNFTGVKFFTEIRCGAPDEVCCRSRSYRGPSLNGFLKSPVGVPIGRQ